MILIKQHLKKSTLTIYFAAGFIFIGTVLFSFINKEVNVIFERPKESGIQTGHSQFHFLVNVTTKKQLVNQLWKVKITKFDDKKLFGSLVRMISKK